MGTVTGESSGVACGGSGRACSALRLRGGVLLAKMRVTLRLAFFCFLLLDGEAQPKHFVTALRAFRNILEVPTAHV
jgi:hypothetical protein